MLLYFGSNTMMHDANTCLCDVDHSYHESSTLFELAAAPRRTLTSQVQCLARTWTVQVQCLARTWTRQADTVWA